MRFKCLWFVSVVAVVGIVIQPFSISAQEVVEEDEATLNTQCDVGPSALSDALSSFGVESLADVPQVCLPIVGTSEQDQVERCYYLLVPICASGTVPLVVDLHGANSCPLDSLTYTGWIELAFSECFVTAWPVGNVYTTDGEESCWNLRGGANVSENSSIGGVTPDCCCRKDGKLIQHFDTATNTTTTPPTLPGLIPVRKRSSGGGDDTVEEEEENENLLFLQTLMTDVVERVPNMTDGKVSIHTGRIYFTGHSNGAMASLAVAARYGSQRIACVASFAGTLITDFAKDYNPVPLWMAHGMLDATIPYRPQQIPPFLLTNLPPETTTNTNQVYSFLGAERMHEVWGIHNGCQTYTINSEANMSVPLSEQVTIATYNDCENGATVRFLSFPGGGQIPYKQTVNSPNTTEMRPGTTPALDTTRDAWDFCKQFENPPWELEEDTNNGTDTPTAVMTTDEPTTTTTETEVPEDNPNNNMVPTSAPIISTSSSVGVGTLCVHCPQQRIIILLPAPIFMSTLFSFLWLAF